LYAEYHIPGIHPARAGKLAFATQHAFAGFHFNFLHLSPFDVADQVPQAEIGE